MRKLTSRTVVPILLMVSVLLLGCGEDEPAVEATYKGKPVSEWILLARDSDFDTSQGAKKALLRLSYSSNEARDYLRKEGKEDVEWLIKKAQEIGDGIDRWHGDNENVVDEFNAVCYGFAGLSKNYLVDAEALIEIALILESKVDLAEIEGYEKQLFFKEVKPKIDRYRDNLSK